MTRGKSLFLAAIVALGSAGSAVADVLREAMATQALAYAIREPPDAAATRGRPKPVAGSHLRSVRPRRSEIDRLILTKATAVGLNPALVQALVRVESGYDPKARSPKGALGLGQLMPGTAALLAVADPLDPEQNLDGSVRYLATLLWEFGDLRSALAAYNAGPDVVRRRRPVPRETVVYVENVLREFRRLVRR